MDESVVFGLVISAVDAAIFIPQAVRAWKFRDSPRALRGISAKTMWIVVFVYSAWLIWDFWTGRWDAHAYAWVGLPTAAFILSVVYRSRKLASSQPERVCPSCGE